MTQNDLKLLKNGPKLLKSAVKLELLNGLSSYSGFRSGLGWEVMK